MQHYFKLLGSYVLKKLKSTKVDNNYSGQKVIQVMVLQSSVYLFIYLITSQSWSASSAVNTQHETPLHPNFFVSRSCRLYFRILEIPSWTGAQEVPCCTAVYALPSQNLPAMETQECLLRGLCNVTQWKCLATWLIWSRLFS